MTSQESQETQPSTEIVPAVEKREQEPVLQRVEGFARLAAPVEELIQQVKDFDRLKRELILSNPAYYQEFMIKGQKVKAIKRSGWRMVQTFFNISDRLILKEKHFGTDNSYGYECHVEAYIPNVKTCVGIAMCWSSEPNKVFPHGEHDVLATAFTRALNRAISDFVGSGEVSAEEMDAHDHHAEVAPPRLATKEQVCSCGHIEKDHLSDGKEYHCWECRREKKDVVCSLKPPGK